MKIGELAIITGCSVQTIRHYEKEGLLASTQRSAGNFRLYEAFAITQLMFIKQCRSLGLALPEIRQLIELSQSPSSACDDVNVMIDKHIDHVECRIRELEELRHQLKSLRGSCSSDRQVEQCGILQKLSTNSSQTPT